MYQAPHKVVCQHGDWMATSLPQGFGLNIFCFIYMKRDWAEHRCYVEALSHTPQGFVWVCIASHVVAHGRMVTSSRQITEVKQRRARLVLGWVTAARSSHVVGHV